MGQLAGNRGWRRREEDETGAWWEGLEGGI